MDIALVSYLYFELSNMIVLAYQLVACVLGFLFCLHVAPKNVKLDVRRKATKKEQLNGSICNKSTYNGASNKTSKKY
jgi:hypothetical protein